MSEYRYLIFRVKPESTRLYGWTKSKTMVKYFLQQRDPSKYKVVKRKDADLEEIFSETNYFDDDAMLQFLKLKSSHTGEDYMLILTWYEMKEAEENIKKYFRELSSLVDIPGQGDYIGMFLHLKDYYASALHVIGFRPPELDFMFDSADYYDRLGGINNYETHDPIMMSIYALESFIRVMIDDL